MFPFIASVGLGLVSLVTFQMTQMNASDDYSPNKIQQDAQQFMRLKNLVRAYDAHSQHPDRQRSGSEEGFTGFIPRPSEGYKGITEDGSPGGTPIFDTEEMRNTQWVLDGEDRAPTRTPSWEDLIEGSLPGMNWKEPTIEYGVEINWNASGWSFVWSPNGSRFYDAVYELSEGSKGVCVVDVNRNCNIPHLGAPLHSGSNLPAGIDTGSIVYSWRNA